MEDWHKIQTFDVAISTTRLLRSIVAFELAMIYSLESLFGLKGGGLRAENALTHNALFYNMLLHRFVVWGGMRQILQRPSRIFFLR